MKVLIYICVYTYASVTFLLLLRHTMTKAIYTRKHLIGDLLTLSTGKYLAIVEESMAMGVKAWHWSLSWQLTWQQQWGRVGKKDWACCGILKPQSCPSDIPLPANPFLLPQDLLILPEEFHQMVTNHSNIWIYGVHSYSYHHNIDEWLTLRS